MKDLFQVALASALMTMATIVTLHKTSDALGFSSPFATPTYSSSYTSSTSSSNSDIVIQVTAQQVKTLVDSTVTIQTDLTALFLAQTKAADRFIDVKSRLTSSLSTLTTSVSDLRANTRTLTIRQQDLSATVERMRQEQADIATRPKPTVIIEKVVEKQVSHTRWDDLRDMLLYLVVMASLFFGVTSRMRRSGLSKTDLVIALEEMELRRAKNSAPPLPRQFTPPAPADVDHVFEARVNEPRPTFNSAAPPTFTSSPVPPTFTSSASPIHPTAEAAPRRFHGQRRAAPTTAPRPFLPTPKPTFTPTAAASAEEAAAPTPAPSKRQVVRRLQDRYDALKSFGLPATFDLEHDGALSRTANNEPILVQVAALSELEADIAAFGPSNGIEDLDTLRSLVADALAALNSTDLVAFAAVRGELDALKGSCVDLATCTNFTAMRDTQEQLAALLNRVAVYAHDKSALVRKARKHLVTDIVVCSATIDERITALHAAGRADEPRFAELEKLRGDFEATCKAFVEPELELSDYNKNGALLPVGAGKVVLACIETLNGLIARADRIVSADNVFDIDVRKERKALINAIQSVQDNFADQIKQRCLALRAAAVPF